MLSLAIKNNRDNEIDVDFLRQALEQTAVDLGPPGKDNDYGSGRIDAFEALRKIPPPPVFGLPNLAGSRIEVSVPEAVVDETVDWTVRVTNTGNGKAVIVTVKVPSIPPNLADITPLDGGTFDPSRREIVWNLPEVVPGQTMALRFRTTAAVEGSVGLVAQISATNAPTITTDPATLTIISPADPYEPNNLPVSAHAIDNPTDFSSERAYLVGEEDWFKFSAPAGKAFWVEVRAWQLGSTLDAKLAITDATGQPLPPDQALMVNANYLGRDPVAIVKGNGGEVFVQVVADDRAGSGQNRGSYILRIREITTSAALENFGAEALIGANALKAGEVGMVFGSLKNAGAARHHLLAFHFAEGLRLVTPSQARFFLPPGPRPADSPAEPATVPGLADWLPFIADPNEAALSELSLPPRVLLNLGRLWVQERGDTLFFRAELVGRVLTTLTEMTLTIDLDANGDKTGDAQVRLTATDQALWVGNTRRSLAYLTVGERTIEVGVKWADLGNPSSLWVRAQLTDNTTGTQDDAPDFGWAKLVRSDAQFAFGVTPAAGTVLGGSSLTIALIADARKATLGTYTAAASLPATFSTLPADVSHSLPVEVVAGPPARAQLSLSSETVPATEPSVQATLAVTDAAGNPIANQRVRWTVTPVALGTIEGSSSVEKETAEDGKSTVVITLTGRVGVLTVQAEVIGTSLVATGTVNITVGAPASLTIATVPAADAEGKVLVPVNGTVVLRASLMDEKGNPVARTDAPVRFQVGIVPVEGLPQVWLVVDGDRTTSALQLADEDGTVNGSAQVTLSVGTKAGTMSISVSVPDLPQQTITVVVQPGIVQQLRFTDAQQEIALQSSLTVPLVRLVGDTLTLTVRASDAHANPVPNRSVTLSIQQGFVTRSQVQTTGDNGEATFSVTFDVPGTHHLAIVCDGVRLPSDWNRMYRVQVLPKLDDVPAEQVRGLGVPFLHPLVPTGQEPPTVSDLLGVDPQALQGRIVRYNPLDPRDPWKFIDPNAPVTTLSSGVGFFIKPRQSVSFRPRTGRLPDRDTVEIMLQTGWNLISFPIPVSLPWRLSTIQVRFGGITQPLAQATTVVAPFLFRWDSGARTYRLVYDRTLAQGEFEGTIEPWEAYFAYAYQPCTLIVPVPFSARKEEVPVRSTQWQLFSLQVQRETESATLLLGLSQDGKGTSVALPPHPTAPHRTALLGQDGTLLGAVIKPIAAKVVWTLTVTGGEREEEVTVSGGNLAALGRKWRLTLIDPVANATFSLRTGAYRFRLAAGEQRQLFVVAEQGQGQPLRVSSLRTVPLRGRTVAIEFGLSAPARVEVSVQSLTGRTVRLVEVGQWRSAGTHRLVWDGTDAMGQLLPAGIYLLRVRAEDEQGRRAQATLWLRLR